jgi:hypothetical protein
MAKIDELNTAWEKYVASRIQPATSVSATASVAQASGQELQEMGRLTKALAKNAEQDSGKYLLTKEALSQMETQIASLQGRLNAAEEKSSIVAVRLASIISQESISNGVKKLQAEGDSTLSALNKQNKIHTCEVKLGEAAKVMQESCDMLAEFSKPSVEKAFAFQLKRIGTRSESEKDPEIKAALNRQKAATEIARKTALDYVQYRRRSIDEWMAGLMAISRDWLKELNR